MSFDTTHYKEPIPLQNDGKSKYKRMIKGRSASGEQYTISVDVYAVLRAFEVVDPAIQHGVKKLLCPGQRGAKSYLTDLMEARASIEDAIAEAM